MTSIDALPDDILLPIFHSCLHEQYLDLEERTRAWQSLVHVCRRWRSVVFGSPRRLDLRLCCTDSTPLREMLDIWPALPLIINIEEVSTGSVDNIVAALECSDRVCHISLWTDTILDCETFLAAMQQPFSELTNLKFRWGYRINDTVVVPDSFLGGFAPRLENLVTLVTLELLNVPHSGYFPPDAMVAALFTLTNLEYFRLEFESPESCPDLETRRLPPSTRFVLPVL